MGIASQDLTGDGRPEVFLTSQADNKLQTLAAGAAGPTYEDIALRRGVTAQRPYVGGDVLPSTAWHPEFADVNNDGLSDLLVTKGNVEAQPDQATRDPSDLFLGQPGGSFVQRGEQSGIVDYQRARGAAVVDLNLDGLLDMVIVHRRANVTLWRNAGRGDASQVEAHGPLDRRAAPAAGAERRRHRRVARRADRRHDDHARGDRRWRPRERGARLAAQRPRLGRPCRRACRVARRHGRAVDDGAGRRADDDRARRDRAARRGRLRGDEMTTTTRALPHLAEIALPDFGMPDIEPLLPADLYAERLERLRSAMDARGYDHLVVWADREHSANLAYLSGFDPRFEEALLVVGPTGDPAVLVGNECEGMAAAAPLPMRVVMFQDFSLPGQARDVSAPLRIDPARRGHPRRRAGRASWVGRPSRRARRSSCRPSWSTSCVARSGRAGWWRARRTS